MIDKKLLRKILLDYRRLISDEEFSKRNENLQIQAVRMISERKIRSLHVFMPIVRNREFDIRPVFNQLKDQGVKMMTSVTDFKRRKMKHFWIDQNTDFVENDLGIPEPINASRADLSDAESIFVPLLAADKSGNRIGYGGGFYDEILKKYKGHSVGICLGTLFDELGTDEWDIPVKQLLFFNGVSQVEKLS